MIITSSHTLSRHDGDAVYNHLKQIAKDTNVVNEEASWNGLNILHNEASKVGAMDLGIQQYQGNDNIRNAKIVYLLAADDFREEDIPEDAFVIYQGHTGDKGAHFADLVLPGASYLEKNATYVNTAGRVQVGRKVVAPPALGREDWAIFRALSEELGQPLPYDTTEELRDRIGELAPHLLKYDVTEPSGFEDLALSHKSNNNELSPVPFADPIDNYYMTEAISRQSSVMARCSKEFNPKKYKNFRDPEFDFSGR
jgi:NADH dehydrogenase (ubiquinone) Fe-S protein 1